ncbi:MAG: D-alanyl-lipoteichoic acid biosynthesis protein DltD [Oscillospiraceae bacterium]|jgi:D-alanine transfer protein|nr:D-alanyl-lipoteichoic acid biosynthesis protein DltD [Oscillospiraceae bacterium]
MTLRGFAARLAVYLVSTALFLLGAHSFFTGEIKGRPFAVSEDNSLVKQKGGYFLDNVPSDAVLILGASELDTKMIPTNPVNLFKNGRGGFSADIVGRGSCQAIIHASILAASKGLSDNKLIFIISPQSFAPQGIMPDMYFANFSELQFCKILMSRDISGAIKSEFKDRFSRLAEQYGGIRPYYQYGWISNKSWVELLSAPYIFIREKLLSVKDAYASYLIYKNAPDDTRDISPIDWEKTRADMLRLAPAETYGNEFGFLNDYYNVNIKRKLKSLQGKDSELSYSNSAEYGDMELLLEICDEKGLRPLLISTPMHGEWSDYTDFDAARRREYYSKVRKLAERFDVEFADFTDEEYTPYFMCDAIHLGYIGWLEVNERISEFYYGGA